jgi:hypothetical protein
VGQSSGGEVQGEMATSRQSGVFNAGGQSTVNGYKPHGGVNIKSLNCWPNISVELLCAFWHVTLDCSPVGAG